MNFYCMESKLQILFGFEFVFHPLTSMVWLHDGLMFVYVLQNRDFWLYIKLAFTVCHYMLKIATTIQTKWVRHLDKQWSSLRLVLVY